MNKTISVILITICCTILVCYSLQRCFNEHNTNYNKVENIDTTYSKVTLDSINSNITYYDSVINNLNNRFKQDEKDIYKLNVDSTIKLFYNLCESE